MSGRTTVAEPSDHNYAIDPMTRSLKPQSLSKLLRPKDRHLRALTERGRLLARLTEVVRACLPLACAEHCSVANLDESRLVLAADSPAWSARLRFHVPELTRTLKRQHGLGIRQVRVVVSPSIHTITPKRQSRPDLSHKSVELLQQTAAGIDDAGLRAALIRLARRGPRTKPT